MAADDMNQSIAPDGNNHVFKDVCHADLDAYNALHDYVVTRAEAIGKEVEARLERRFELLGNTLVDESRRITELHHHESDTDLLRVNHELRTKLRHVEEAKDAWVTYAKRLEGRIHDIYVDGWRSDDPMKRLGALIAAAQDERDPNDAPDARFQKMVDDGMIDSDGKVLIPTEYAPKTEETFDSLWHEAQKYGRPSISQGADSVTASIRGTHVVGADAPDALRKLIERLTNDV